jgi:hypothetical protein
VDDPIDAEVLRSDPGRRFRHRFSIRFEAALAHLGIRPDLVLSLGGESFVAYCLAGGMVRRMMSSNRCAAGSGEFLVQQFGRMNLDLTSGLIAAQHGRLVILDPNLRNGTDISSKGHRARLPPRKLLHFRFDRPILKTACTENRASEAE